MAAEEDWSQLPTAHAPASGRELWTGNITHNAQQRPQLLEKGPPDGGG